MPSRYLWAHLLQVSLGLVGPVLAPGAAAQPWTPIGPDGGTVRRLAVDPRDPSRVLALSGSPLWPLFASTDGGLTWAAFGSGASSGGAIAFAPSAPSIVYLGADSGQVYRSTDGGASFGPVGSPLPGLDPGDLLVIAVDPQDASTVLAATYGGHGIFRSTDGGSTWMGPTTASVPFTTFELRWDPGIAGTVFAAGGSAVRLARSTDAGATWADAGSQLEIPGSLLQGARDVVVGAGSPPILSVLALSFGASVPGAERVDVLRSTDGGGSWVAVGPAAAGSGVRLLIDPLDELRLACLQQAPALLSVSTDGGGRWSSFELPEPFWILDGALVPAGAGGPDAVLAGGFFAGPFRVDPADGSATPGVGYRVARVLDLVATDDRLLAATGAALWRSESRGASWSALPTPRQLRHAFDVEADSGDPGLILAIFAGGLGRSLDGGSSWEPIDLGLAAHTLWQVQATGISGTFLMPTSEGLRRSTDGGATWLVVAGLPGGELVAAAGPVAYLSGGVGGQAAVFRSTDAGATWAPTALVVAGESVDSMAVDPLSPDRLFVSGSFGFMGSSDGGASWSPVSLPIAGARVAGAFVDRGHRLWVGLDGGGLWSSLDDGETWQAEGFAGLGATVLAEGSDAVYATVSGSGAFRRDVERSFFADGFESGDTSAWTSLP